MVWVRVRVIIVCDVTLVYAQSCTGPVKKPVELRPVEFNGMLHVTFLLYTFMLLMCYKRYFVSMSQSRNFRGRHYLQIVNPFLPG